jgi:hypothetical protein
MADTAADVLPASLHRQGVRQFFANPGTERHVDALLRLRRTSWLLCNVSLVMGTSSLLAMMKIFPLAGQTLQPARAAGLAIL